jgi:hypothetical protein
MLCGVTLAAMNKTSQDEASKVSADHALEHLDAILASSTFSSSKRCQEFLRYIVLEAVHGRGDLISERNIAYEVFGKGTNFEPGEDSLVRVKAREVRKRLSDYYESAPDKGIKIEIPLGAYVPRIHPSHDLSAPGTPHESEVKSIAKQFDRRRFAWMLGSSVAALGAAALTYPLFYRHNAPLDLLWRPVFATKMPLLIFIPVLTDRRDGTLTDRVGIGPAAALRRAADFLTKHNYPYHLRFGTDLTFSQLREQPSLILGGFSSIWTLRMTQNLRFNLVQGEDLREPEVIDRQTNQVWKAVNPTANGYADQDYGILCRLFDAESGQIVLVAAGITTFATEAAASVLFDPESFSSMVKQAPGNWETKNFEAVIRVSIIGTTPSSPQLVATHFW